MIDNMKSIDFCIRILFDHINLKETTKSDEHIDWDIVINFFKCHEMMGVLYYQCKNFIPIEYKDIVERLNASIIYYYNNRIWLEKRLRELMNEHSIRFCIVKGFSVASFYPCPELRTMGDTDLIVNSEDKENVHNLLVKFGFRNICKINGMDWKYLYNNMELELHDRLVYYEITNDSRCDEYFNNFWKFEKEGLLDWNFHFLFLIYHIRKHFINRGVGFRHFLDIAVLTKNNNNLDWVWIKQKLTDLGMWEFSQRVFYLNSYWFGVTSPYSIPSFDNEFLHDATRDIYYSGIFGFDNEDNNVNYTIHGIRYAHKRNYGIRKILTFIFPSYETMRKVNHYSFLNNRPYLLPVAWGYRGIKSLKRKLVVTKLKDTINTSFVSKKKVDERAEVLRKWGLD